MTTSFDRVARPYRWMEYATFGASLERCRYAQLEHLGNARSALILGDGDGRFLAKLLEYNPSVTADVVDSSDSMLRILDRRIHKMGGSARDRVHLHSADALSWEPRGSYDLVVTHFFLDCFFPHELEQLLDRLLPHVAPDAQWVVSEFAIPDSGIAQYTSAAVVGVLYRSFGLLTGLHVRMLPDYAACLRNRGWVSSNEVNFLGGLLQSQLWRRSASSVQR